MLLHLSLQPWLRWDSQNMIASCLYPSHGDTVKSSPRPDAWQHTLLPASDQFALFLIPCIMSMFLPSRTTSCGTLHSLGITPTLRYGHCSLYRVPSLHCRPLVFLLLRWNLILRYYTARSGCASQRPVFSVTRLVAPSSVRSARCSLRPREAAAMLALTLCRISSAPEYNG